MKPILFNDLASQWQEIKDEAQPKLIKFLEDGYYIGGPYLEKFEDEFAEYTGRRYAIGISNGTDGLRLAIEALDLSGKVNVIIQANGYVADIMAVKYQINADYKITLIDNNEYFQIDTDKLEYHLSQNSNQYDHIIIIPIHLYGHPSDMSRISECALKYDCYIIEDASQSHGAHCYGKMIGSASDITVYSLYPGKNLGAFGDAGIITTDDEKLAKILIKIRNYGSIIKYHNEINGMNCRLDPLQCIFLSEKLKLLEKWNSDRINIAEKYKKKLIGIKQVELPRVAAHAKHVYHLYTILCESRNDLLEFLNQNHIPCLIHYPIPLEKLDCNKDLIIEYKNNNALNYADRLISLPMHPYLTDDQVDFVCEKIKQFYSINGH